MNVDEKFRYMAGLIKCSASGMNEEGKTRWNWRVKQSGSPPSLPAGISALCSSPVGKLLYLGLTLPHVQQLVGQACSLTDPA